MSTIERTAYPRYSKRRRMKSSELEEYYTLSTSEVSFMNRYARGDKYRLNFAIQLKTLGYSEESGQIGQNQALMSKC